VGARAVVNGLDLDTVAIGAESALAKFDPVVVLDGFPFNGLDALSVSRLESPLLASQSKKKSDELSDGERTPKPQVVRSAECTWSARK
jgi:hypothetical protein